MIFKIMFTRDNSLKLAYKYSEFNLKNLCIQKFESL